MSLTRARSLLLALSIFALPSAVGGQQTFELKGVLLDPDGDGLVGHVDFRARATCAGADPGLQMAVDRIVVDGIRIGGEQYAGANVPGFSLPLEVSGGVLFLRGGVGSDTRWFDANPGSIGANLGGFLDWITFEDADVPDDWDCSDWKKFFDQVHVRNRLEIYRTEGLGDRLFYRMKEAYESLEKAKARLSELEAQLDAAETPAEYEAFIRSAEGTKWPEGASGGSERTRAAELVRYARSRLKTALDRGKKQEQAEKAAAEQEERKSSGGSGGAAGGSGKDGDSAPEGKEEKEEKEQSAASEPPEAARSADEERARRYVENMAAYRKAISQAQAAEARGDRRAAIRHYETALGRKPSEELRRKVRYEKGALAANDLGQAVAKMFLGDPNRELREWTAKINQRNAALERMIREERNAWLDMRRHLIEYNLLAISLLTGSDSLLRVPYKKHTERLPMVSSLKPADVVLAPSRVIAAEARLPASQRSDSIFVFALQVEAQDYASDYALRGGDIALQKEINARLPGPIKREDVSRGKPRLTLRHAPVLAYPTHALIHASANPRKRRDFDFDREMLAWTRPFGHEANSTSKSRRSAPLLIAAPDRALLEETRRLLLKSDAPNVKAESGKYQFDLLHIVPNAPVAAVLIAAGGDVEMREEFYGLRPIHAAVDWGDAALVRTLLERGADVDAAAIGGGTPLVHAAFQGHLEVVRTLLEFGADVDLDGTVEKVFGPYTPLSAARKKGHTAIVKLLEARGATEKLGKTRERAMAAAEAARPSPDEMARRLRELTTTFGPPVQQQIKKLKAEPLAVIAHEEFSVDRTSRTVIGTRQEVRDGRLFVENPKPGLPGGVGAGEKGWRFPPRSAVALRFEMRHEAGPVDPPSGTPAAFPMNGHVAVELTGPEGTTRVSIRAQRSVTPRSYAMAGQVKGGKFQTYVPWKNSAAVRPGNNLVEIIYVSGALALHINGYYVQGLTGIPLSSVEQVEIWASPMTRYSFDNVIVLRLGDEAEAEYTAGLRAYRMERYEEAADRFKKALRRDKNIEYYHVMLGYALLRRGEVKKAIKAFEEGVKRFPRRPNPHDSLGEAYMAAGRLEDAKRSYEAAVALGQQIGDPKLSSYRENLASVIRRIEQQ